MFSRDAEARSSQKMRIIVADDDASLLRILSRQLEQAGHEVLPCADGAEALRAIQSEGRGLVLADWMMPGLSGPELCRATRELQQVGAIDLFYFILLTACQDPKQIIEGFEAGADDFLTKPYQSQELLARLRVGLRLVESYARMVDSQLDLHKTNAQMAVLNKKLDRLANTDSLTGVHNRRFLLERFAEAWTQAGSDAKPLSCCMLDIDHFKRINDTYGHAAGDYVLKAVSKAAKLRLRRCDHFGRIGGEEFCVVMPDTPLADAAGLAEQIRKVIMNLKLEHEGRRIAITTSVGVAQRYGRHSGFEPCLADADALLYKAKQHGRNQVWVSLEDGGQSAFAALPAQTVPSINETPLGASCT